MDRLNREFQAILAQKNFAMKTEEKEHEWLYHGKLFITEKHIVHFSVSLSKSEESSFGQIVFRNIAFIGNVPNRSEFLELINEINVEYGMFYYFCVDKENNIFARYVNEVAHDLEQFFHVLVQGPVLLKEVLPRLREKFDLD